MDWQMVPAWVVVVLFVALIFVAFHVGLMKAELDFTRADAARYSWLRRQTWTRDWVERMNGQDIDRVCDVGLIQDRLKAHQAKTHKPGDWLEP